MANDPKLVVSLEARLNQFERQLKKATKSADTSFRRIETRAATMSSKLSGVGAMAFGPFKAGAIAALAPVLSLTAALNGARSALTEFDRIGKAAKAGGLDAGAYQEYAYAAELGGVSADQFSKALETLAKNTGLAAAGKGRLITQLKAMNPELLRSLQLATTQEERLRLVADALDKESDASRKAAIASALFGDTGARMVEVLRGGSAALDDTAAKARKLGLVVDADLIARAEELNDELGTATRVMDLQFKQALINLAPVMVYVATTASHLAADIRGLIDSFRDLDGQSSTSLSGKLRDLGSERLEVENKILATREQQSGITGALAQAEKRLLDGTINSLQQRLQLIGEEEEKILAIVNGRQMTQPGAPPVTPGIPEDPGAGKERSKRAEAALKEAEAVKELIADLEYERSLIGETDVARAKANAIRQAGAAATVEQRRAIGDLIEAIYEETAATERASRAVSELRSIGKDALGGFIKDLRSGTSAADALDNALNKVVDKLLDIALNSVFDNLFSGLGGGGILSSLLGGGLGAFPAAPAMPGIGLYAKGGINSRGRDIPLRRFSKGGVSNGAAIFGEAGPEAAVPLPDGRRIPVDLRMPSVPRNGGPSGPIIIRIIGEEGETFSARVQQISGQVSGVIVQAATPGIVERSTAASGQTLARGGYDGGMSRFGVAPQAKVR